MIDAHAHACGGYLDCESIPKQLEKIKAEAVVLCGGEPQSRICYPHPLLSAVWKNEKLAFGFNRFIARMVKRKGLAATLDEGNATVCALAKLLPQRVFPTYHADPAEQNAMQKLEAFYSGHRFYLLKLHQCYNSFDIASPVCEQLITWAKNHAVPIFIHLKNGEQAFAFTDVANRHSNAVFIVAHLIGCDIISRHLKNDNVYFDLSSPQLYSYRMLRRVYERYGASRLIFGTDSPYGLRNDKIILHRLKRLKLDEQQLYLITDGNIKSLLKI